MSYEHKHAVENTRWFPGRVKRPIKPGRPEKLKKPHETEGVSVLAIQAVLSQLANHVNTSDDERLRGWAWPSRKTLAQESSLSPATVDNVLEWARYLGFFQIVRNVVDENGLRHPNRYKFRELITIGATTIMGADGQEHQIGGKVVYKPKADQEGGWMPDESLRGTIACKAEHEKVIPPLVHDEPAPLVATTTPPMVATTTPSGGHHPTPSWSPPHPIVATTIPCGGDHQTYSGDHEQTLLVNPIIPIPIRGELSSEGGNSSTSKSRAAGATAPPPAAMNDRSKAQQEKPPKAEIEEIEVKEESEEPEPFENRWLAQELQKYLGTSYNLDALEKDFKKKFLQYPEYTNYKVAQIMEFIFEDDQNGKHKRNLIEADQKFHHPVSYLFSILKYAEETKETLEQKAFTSAAGAADSGGFGHQEDFGEPEVARTFDLDE